MRPEPPRVKTYNDEDAILVAEIPFLWNVHAGQSISEQKQSRPDQTRSGRWALEIIG